MSINCRWLVGVTAENRTDQTSLSVNMRKAAGRVWWIDPFLLQGKYHSTPYCWLHTNLMSCREGVGDVSVCECAEGSRACGGSIGVVTGVNILQASDSSMS